MEKLIDIKQIQEILGVGKDWIFERVKRGELQSHKLGRYLRFKASDIETLIENHKAQVKAPSKDTK